MEVGSEELIQFVWAKLEDYPYWPGITISEPDAAIGARHVYFFGTHDYTWVREQYILPYIPNKDRFQPECNTPKFNAAIQEIEEHILKTRKDPSYKVSTGSRQSRKIIEYNIPKHDRKRCKLSAVENGTMNVASASYSKLVTIKSISTVGIISTEVMGDIIAEKLSGKNYTINIWNPTKKETTTKQMVCYKSSPREVLQNADIVFICMRSQDAALDIIKKDFKLGDLRDCTLKNKRLLLCTMCHPETINEINSKIEKKGGSLLDVMIKKINSDECGETLLLHTSGSKFLFDVCQSSCFRALGCCYYHSELGYATKMNLTITLMAKVCQAGLAEVSLLAKNLDFTKEKWTEITFDLVNYLNEKMNLINTKDHGQYERSLLDFHSTLGILMKSEEMEEHLKVNTAIFKIIENCISQNYGNCDISVLFNNLCRKFH